MAERSISLRLAVRDHEQARKALLGFGEEGERALRKIELAAPRASNALQVIGPAAERAGSGIRSGLAAAGPQIQDFVVQVTAGQSAFVAFSQQAPQFLSAFGPVGIALGTVAGLAGAAAGAIFGLGREQDAATAAADSHRAALEAESQTMLATAENAEALRQRYAGLTDTLRELERLEIGQALRKANEDLAQQRAAAEALVQDLERLASRDLFEGGANLGPLSPEAQARRSRSQALFDIIDRFRSGGDLSTLTIELNKLVDGAGEAAERLKALTLEFLDSAKAGLATEESVKRLQTALAILDRRETTAEQDALIGSGKQPERVRPPATARTGLGAAPGAGDRAVERFESFARQVEAEAKAVEQLARAQERGEEAYADTRILLEAQNRVRGAGIDLLSKEGQALVATITTTRRREQATAEALANETRVRQEYLRAFAEIEREAAETEELIARDRQEAIERRSREIVELVATPLEDAGPETAGLFEAEFAKLAA